MEKKVLWAIVLLAGTVLPGTLRAQDPVFAVRHSYGWSETRQDGQCLIRVVVDNQADVELRWDKLLVRTLTGQPGRDNGSECNAPLPQAGVTNFQFQRVEGPGEVQLMQQPNASNGWAAVVRLRDPQNGEHAYTFRVSWNWDGTPPQNASQNERFRRRDSLEQGRVGRGRYNPERVCREAVADKILQEWSARIVSYGDRADSQAQNEGIWSYGGQANIEGRAQVSTGSERRQINFNCTVNSNDNTVQQVSYQFVNRPFSWTPNRTGSADRQAADVNPNVISDCQNQIRDRVLSRHGRTNIDFRDISRKWWEGNTQRVNGKAQVNSRGYTSTIEYNCTAKGEGIDWADFKILTGTLPSTNNYR